MEYLLRMEHIEKYFSGVPALKDVSLHIRPGEVHALIGENGAGKSTLMKILSGVHKKDGGRKLTDIYPKADVPPGDVVLSVAHLCAGRAVRDVSFSVRPIWRHVSTALRRR